MFLFANVVVVCCSNLKVLERKALKQELVSSKFIVLMHKKAKTNITTINTEENTRGARFWKKQKPMRFTG